MALEEMDEAAADQTLRGLQESLELKATDPDEDEHSSDS